MSVTAAVVLLLLGSFLSKIVRGDPLALFDLARFALIGVLWAAVWGVSRLFRA